MSMNSRNPRTLFLFGAAAAMLAAACGGGDEAASGKTRVTIYASIYENVIAKLDPAMEKAMPDLEIEWYQKGSEEVAAKVNAELAAGGTRADVLMTSDPFWYLELMKAGKLLPHASPAAGYVSREFTGEGSAFTTVRMPVVVVAFNAEKVPEAARPASFADLAEKEIPGGVTMGDPLSSGSAFTAVAALSAKYGWEYFEKLRAKKAVAAGGNGAVLQRLTSGEAGAGIILLENVLKARADNPSHPVQFVIPSDGVILVPSPAAVTADSKVPEAARRVVDFMLGEEGQRSIVEGFMYSLNEAVPPPAGGPAWSEIKDRQLVPWTPEYLASTHARREEIKKSFSKAMGE